VRYPEAARDFDVAEALLADAGLAGQAGLADHADDAVVDQWLELMVDGRAALHLMRSAPDRALAVLERARPLLEARGGPARRATFYRAWTLQRVQRNRFRVDEEDLAGLRAGIAEAERAGEDKDVGYATYFLGWALWLRGDLPAAAEELTRALALAERIGETHLRGVALLYLCRTALRRHDTEAVRILLPQTLAAESAAEQHHHGLAGGLAIAAWLAWQDGQPAEVIRLAAEIEACDLSVHVSGAAFRWVYLFPVLAARLRAGEPGEAVAAARQIIDPAQQALPGDLTTALAGVCGSWDQGERAQVTERLTRALDLARAAGYL
jgi:hypothetical protein